jgi:hypothetical protein
MNGASFAPNRMLSVERSGHSSRLGHTHTHGHTHSMTAIADHFIEKWSAKYINKVHLSDDNANLHKFGQHIRQLKLFIDKRGKGAGKTGRHRSIPLTAK